MRIKIIFILLFILLFMLAGFVYGAIPADERAALIALYESTSGDGWTNRDGWKTGDDFSISGTEGTWHGITVVDDHVTSIDLNNNNLDGTIPAKLGNLTNLLRLYLYNNKLTGKIPPELGDLSNLVGLSLVFNQLSDKIPAELGNLTNLKWLYLYQNQLTGSIPVDLFALSNLVHLYLNDNRLDGNIPPKLDRLNLSSLKTLYLSRNQLQGSIPTWLGNLTTLENLLLNNNLLTGEIPPELGSLSKLQKLYLNYNKLDGAIPRELGNLPNLLELYLNDNQLSGEIPTVLGNLSNLRKLYLSRNRLTGGIPPDLGKLSYLEGLYLNDNQLSEKIPPELGDLLNLGILYLSRNRLRGSIPGNLGNLDILLVLQLNSNQLQLDNTSTHPNITSLKNLLDELSDFRWNALYTNDATMKDFLKSKQWGKEWENTQTILPTNITANAKSANSVEVSWSPIAYADDPGGYDVFYSLNPGDSNAPLISTTSKSQSSLEVTGLNPLTTYHFWVQSRTDPHANNKNTVLSEISAEVSAPTSDIDKTISGKVTDAAGVGMEGVTLTFSSSSSTGTGTEEKKVISKADGTYECKIHHGWKVTVTPSKDNSLFSPPHRDYSDIQEDKLMEDYRLSVSLSLSASWEEDKTTLIKIDYGKISLSYSLINSRDMALKEFVIYRKVSGGVYEEIKSFTNLVDKVSGELSYNDKYLNKNKTYTYIARAVDTDNKTLVESNEITIAVNK